MSISKREKVLIIVVVLLALLGVYYLYYLKPCMEKIEDLKVEIASSQAELSTLALQKSQQGTLEEQLAEVDAGLAKYADGSAQAFDQPPILVFLSKTAGDNAIKGAIYFDFPVQVGQIQRCPISITVTCTYDGLRTLLSDLSSAPYLLRVTSISAGLPTEDDGTDETASGDTSESSEPQTPLIPNGLEVKLTLDFFCLTGDIPVDTAYEFDTGRQYGGDIFY
jgi:Tfp pilus assembly protein PilO